MKDILAPENDPLNNNYPYVCSFDPTTTPGHTKRANVIVEGKAAGGRYALCAACAANLLRDGGDQFFKEVGTC